MAILRARTLSVHAAVDIEFTANSQQKPTYRLSLLFFFRDEAVTEAHRNSKNTSLVTDIEKYKTKQLLLTGF